MSNEKPYPKQKDYKNARANSDSRKHEHTDFTREVRYLAEPEMLLMLSKKKDVFVLILDCVQDPHNLGACLRTADGAGVDAVIVPKDKSVDVTDTVRRVACGASESVPFVRVTNLARTMEKLKEMGIWLTGTSDQSDKFLYDVDLTGSVGIVMGAEGDGLRRLTKEGCDFLVQIPMAGEVPCLNVSVATGICLYEVVRQRKQKSIK
jgi:23S rRNA (guanosine2251-2'-O)-methyltransferase